MEQHNEEYEKLRQRWEYTAQTIQALRSQERKEVIEYFLQIAVSSIATFGFVIGTSVWLAHRIMMH